MPNVTVLATVNEIKDLNFCYPFCNVCRCKTLIFPLDPTRRKCSRNGHIQLDSETQYCYRLSLDITDGEQICPVTLFGDAVVEIFGDTATNIKGYISYLENSLQGLAISLHDLISEAMNMAICNRTFSFDFNLPASADTTGRIACTLNTIKTKLGSGAIARAMLVTPPSVDVFTVTRGIKLLVKRFLSKSCNSPSFDFSLLDNDTSRWIEPCVNARSMSFRSSEVSRLFDDDILEVVPWEIRSTNESRLTWPITNDNYVVSPNRNNTDTCLQNSSTDVITDAASPESWNVKNAGPNGSQASNNFMLKSQGDEASFAEELESFSLAESQKMFVKDRSESGSNKLKIISELAEGEKNFSEALHNLQILKLGQDSCPELTSTPNVCRHKQVLPDD